MTATIESLEETQTLLVHALEWALKNAKDESKDTEEYSLGMKLVFYYKHEYDWVNEAKREIDFLEDDENNPLV